MKAGRSLKGDLLGGLVVALLSLPMTIPLGALAFSPLGPDYMAAGVAAGFQTSIVAGLASALAGGSRYQISGPRASVALICAESITVALNNGVSPPQAMAASALVVFLGGIVQIAFGSAKVGRAIKYIPYPVLAGFMNGVAILILLGELAATLGLPATMKWTAIPAQWSEISLPAVAVACITMATMKMAPRLTDKLPPIVLAFAVGVGADQMLRHMLGDAAVGPLVGALTGDVPTPAMLASVMRLPWSEPVPHWLLAELPTMVVLALVGSIEALLSAAAIDAVTGDRHDGNRELIGQGLGNCLAACCGGIASTGAPIRGVTSFKLGSRTRFAGVFHSLVLLMLLIWGKPVLAALPYSVMGGIMIAIALSMTDNWAFVLVRRKGRSFVADLMVVVVVAATTVVFNLATAVFAGLVLTLLLFMLRMSRPVVRRVLDRTQTKSLRQRPLSIENFLFREGRTIVIVDLDGPLFFGTTELFRDEIERLDQRSPQVVILDMHKVRYIDLAGVRTLIQIARHQGKVGQTLLLAGLVEGTARHLWLMSTGLGTALPAGNIFATRDRALEYAEDIVAASQYGDLATEIPLADIEILNGVPFEDITRLAALLERREYLPGEAIFRQGDDGDGFFLVTSGEVEISLPGAPPIRLATAGPGTIFGEMALLSGCARSADAVARERTVLQFLAIDKFNAFHHAWTTPAVRILLNIGRELSERLRLANLRLQGDQ